MGVIGGGAAAADGCSRAIVIAIAIAIISIEISMSISIGAVCCIDLKVMAIVKVIDVVVACVKVFRQGPSPFSKVSIEFHGSSTSSGVAILVFLYFVVITSIVSILAVVRVRVFVSIVAIELRASRLTARGAKRAVAPTGSLSTAIRTYRPIAAWVIVVIIIVVVCFIAVGASIAVPSIGVAVVVVVVSELLLMLMLMLVLIRLRMRRLTILTILLLLLILGVLTVRMAIGYRSLPRMFGRLLRIILHRVGIVYRFAAGR